MTTLETFSELALPTFTLAQDGLSRWQDLVQGFRDHTAGQRRIAGVFLVGLLVAAIIAIDIAIAARVVGPKRAGTRRPKPPRSTASRNTPSADKRSRPAPVSFSPRAPERRF